MDTVPGVREHVEDVALGLGGVEAVADARGAEGAVLLPVPLPPRLDLVVRVRPPRLRLPRVGTGAAAAPASSARREAAEGEQAAAAVAVAGGRTWSWSGVCVARAIGLERDPNPRASEVHHEQRFARE